MSVLPELFRKYTGVLPEEVLPMAASGSPRQYCRLRAGKISLVGATGVDADENRAFFAVGASLRANGIAVPRVVAVSDDGMAYLQEDLGDTSLFSLLPDLEGNGPASSFARNMLIATLEQLPVIQFEGARGLDWNVCYPEPSFGEATAMFDLNYFKYCFLKTTALEFNETKLQKDFVRLCSDLCSFSGDTFMYRDFQSRNVMVRDGRPWFIDFQGGRRGPVHYDVASFLWQARAGFADSLKEELLGVYLRSLKRYVPDADASTFVPALRLFVLFRTLQVLGAYGYRGWTQGRPHFVKSIPAAIANLRKLLDGKDITTKGTDRPFAAYPYLEDTLRRLADLPQFAAQDCAASHCTSPAEHTLEVEVYSFSFKKGIPEDRSGNGGGYVFDCRSTHNPGRIPYYRQFTGLDGEVIRFLEEDGEITAFLSNVYPIVDHHVERFLERGFSHLQIAFGCTGGQHRSVYCAQHTAEHLKEKYGVRVHLVHREQGIDTCL